MIETVILESVELCEDMSCVIMNEAGYAIADAVLDVVDKKPELENAFINEQYYNYDPNYKWWVVSLRENKELQEVCNDF